AAGRVGPRLDALVAGSGPAAATGEGSAVTEVLFGLAGLVVGGGLAWGLARGHYRARAVGEREALAARLAAAEAVGDGARKQLTQSEHDLGAARQERERGPVGRRR